MCKECDTELVELDFIKTANETEGLTAKMSRQLEEAYRDGPGAVVHVTSNDRTFEYVVDLSSMMQVCASF